jgi:spore maturation protein CgeB
MRVLLVDTTQYRPSTPLFAEALAEVSAEKGWECRFFDEAPFLAGLDRSLVQKLAFHVLRRRPLTYWALNLSLRRACVEFQPDVTFVVKGAHIAPATLAWIQRRSGCLLINYATDDPFNKAVNTADLVKGIRFYDLYACTKRAILDDVERMGARRVAYVPFGYKPDVHFPENVPTAEERSRFEADVAFVGGCDEDRVPYFRALGHECPGIRLRLYGSYWNRYPEFESVYRGVVYGREYRLAVGMSQIVVNLVRRANRDGHVMRTFELPACRAFVLTERTPEHEELFREHAEAAYFATPEDLVSQVKYFLGRPEERERLRAAAHEKVVFGGHTYKDRLHAIFNVIGIG